MRWVGIRAQTEYAQRQGGRVDLPGRIQGFDLHHLFALCFDPAASEQMHPCPGDETQRQGNVGIVVVQGWELCRQFIGISCLP